MLQGAKRENRFDNTFKDRWPLFEYTRPGLIILRKTIYISTVWEFAILYVNIEQGSQNVFPKPRASPGRVGNINEGPPPDKLTQNFWGRNSVICM